MAPRNGHPRSQWQCPNHQDATPSLSLSEGEDGRVLIHCQAGCPYDVVMAALSCPIDFLFTAPRHDPAKYAAFKCRGLRFPPLVLHSTSDSCHESFHYYGDGWRMERRRTPGGSKVISWETRDGRGAWIPGLRDATPETLPLYRERELRQAIGAGEPILLVESESSCDAIKGWYATTWAGGASTPRIATIRRVLGDYPHVVVIGDHDEAGRKCTAKLAAAGVAPHVVFSPLDGEDARDLYYRLGPTGFTILINDALTEEESE